MKLTDDEKQLIDAYRCMAAVDAEVAAISAGALSGGWGETEAAWRRGALAREVIEEILAEINFA